MKLNSAVVAAFVLCSALTCSAADLSIERLAPEDSVLVVNVRNVDQVKEHLHRTGLWSLWQSEQVKAMVEQPLKEMREELETALKEVGQEPDALACPDGHVGFAVTSVMSEELGIKVPSFLLVIDFGSAEKADKAANLIAALNKKGEEDGDLRLEEKEVNGRTVHIMCNAALEKREQEERERAAKGGEEEWEEEEWEEMGGGPSMEEIMKAVHYVREENAFIVSTDFNAMASALDAVDGKPFKSIADSPEYEAVLDQIGHEDQDVTAVLLTSGLMDVVGDSGGMAMMMLPMLKPAFGSVHGVGMGMRLDSQGAMTHQTLALYMPEGKVGLTALLDTQVSRRDVPRFVPSNALSYTVMNFEFSGVTDFVKSFVNSNPLLAQQGAAALEQIEPMLRQVCASMGSEIHIMSVPAVPGPGTPGGLSRLVALQCVKPQDFENAIAAFAPQLGMEPRDFLGQRIYTMKESFAAMMGGGMAPDGPATDPISVGIGGGYAFFGATPAVEQALRANTQTDGATLGTDGAFQRAAGILPAGDAVAWTYSNTIDQAEAAAKSVLMEMEAQAAAIREWDAAMADEFEAANRQQRAMLEKIDYALLRRYVGSTIGQVRATEKGYVADFYLLGVEGSTP